MVFCVKIEGRKTGIQGKMENHYRGERDGGKCKIRGGGHSRTPGERIVKLCEKQQISQRELARRIGVTSSQISRILKGETKTINSDMLMALAQEFGVSTDYILGIVNNPENTQSVENTENLAAESKDMEERRNSRFTRRCF